MARPAGDTLSARLSQRMLKRLPSQRWSSGDAMAAAADRVALLFADSLPDAVDPNRLRDAVRRLAGKQDLRDVELRLCCAGASTPVELDNGPSQIIDNDALTSRLLAEIRQRSGNDRMTRRCASGLAHALLLPAVRPSDGPGVNAGRLATFVTDDAAAAVRASGQPSPVAAIRTVFVDGSTEQFWPYVLDGDRSVILPLLQLGVPEASWLWRTTILDAINHAAGWSDDGFVAAIDLQVGVLLRHPLVLDEGLGLILDRLARVAGVAEHDRLRVLAVERWGSPLQPDRRPHWYRWTTEAARRMVAGWLTRRVIAAFFETLAGGDADPRRTRFWSRYAELADEVLVFLNADTRRNGGEALGEIRRALGGAVGAIDDEFTNVFVLVINGYAFVEFSTTGNALYVYDREGMPSGFERTRPTVSQLKDQGMAADRLVHIGSWEERARDRVGSLTGHWVALR